MYIIFSILPRSWSVCVCERDTNSKHSKTIITYIHTNEVKKRKHAQRKCLEYNTHFTCCSCIQTMGPLLRLQLKRREPYFCINKFLIEIYVRCIWWRLSNQPHK